MYVLLNLKRRKLGVRELVTLLEAQTRSARGGSPVFLVNGRRISGFREIRGIPPEAIERFDVLPEETALSYGYSANQRVVNIVLKADFKSLTASVNVSRPEQGGRTTTTSENNVLRIAGADRWSLDINGTTANTLFETERDIDRSTTAGGDSELANAYRTLLPKTDELSVSGTYKHDLNDKVGMTLSGSLEDSSSFSYLGLPGVTLTLPDGTQYGPGGVLQFTEPTVDEATGTVTLDGDPEARVRPMGPVLRALEQLGVRIDAPEHAGPEPTTLPITEWRSLAWPTLTSTWPSPWRWIPRLPSASARWW